MCAPLVLDSYFIGDRSVGRACGATASSIDYDVIDSPGALFISSPPSIRILVLSRAYVCFKFYSARPVAPVLLSVLAATGSFILCCERGTVTHTDINLTPNSKSNTCHYTHHTQPLKKNRERARRTPQIRRNAVHPGTGIGESHDAYVHTDRKSGSHA